MSQDRLRNSCIHSDGGCNCLNEESPGNLAGICMPSIRPLGLNNLLVNPYTETPLRLADSAETIRDNDCVEYKHPFET